MDQDVIGTPSDHCTRFVFACFALQSLIIEVEGIE